jgi:hypothetical protein
VSRRNNLCAACTVDEGPEVAHAAGKPPYHQNHIVHSIDKFVNPISFLGRAIRVLVKFLARSHGMAGHLSHHRDLIKMSYAREWQHRDRYISTVARHGALAIRALDAEHARI